MFVGNLGVGKEGRMEVTGRDGEKGKGERGGEEERVSDSWEQRG